MIPGGKIFMWLLVTGSLVVGTIAQTAIYSHILKTKMSELPINILILLEHIVRHICSSVMLTALSISLLFDESIKELAERYHLANGTAICWTFYYFAIILVVNLNQNGLGIAIVRLIYIKKGSWMKYKFGEMRLIHFTNICMTLSTTALAYIATTENTSQRSPFNMCTGHSEKFQVRSHWESCSNAINKNLSRIPLNQKLKLNLSYKTD